MSLLGSAVVAIWNDILPEARSEFIAWHNREHIPERVAIPGFLRGRRFMAQYGTPQYFTLYEAEDTAVLVGPDYLHRLNNPTSWTRQVMQAFRNTSRGVCCIAFSQGEGDGGAVLSLRFDAAPGRANELLAQFKQALLPPLEEITGIVGVHLVIADQAGSVLETAERRGRSVAVPSWVLMIEASFPGAADEAADTLLNNELTRHGAVGPFERGLYVLEICRHKSAVRLALAN